MGGDGGVGGEQGGSGGPGQGPRMTYGDIHAQNFTVNLYVFIPIPNAISQ
jgi:hypothetical protein